MMSHRQGSAPRAPWSYHSVRLLVLTAMPAMLGLLLLMTLRSANYLTDATRAVLFPFGLDYGEGIVWQQALLIPGPQMYGKITQPPFIVFEYPPVYHLLVRGIATLGIDPLAAGRGISLAATIAIMILAGSITFTAIQEVASTKVRLLGSMVTGLMVLTYRPIEEWAVLMRVDMLAVSFSMAGVYLSTLSGRRNITLYSSIILFVTAVYTKQTELSAPIAVLLVVAIINLRSALKALGFSVIVGVAGFVLLIRATHGGFFRHIIEYNLHNRFLFDYAIDQLLMRKSDTLGLLTGVVAFALLWWTEARSCYPVRDLRAWIAAIRQSKKLRALSIVSLWFILASAQLITLGRPGSWDNYFIEWMCITTVPIGMAATVAWVGVATGGKSALFSGLAGLFLSLALGTHALHGSPFEYSIVDDPKATALRAHLVDLIRKSGEPVLSEDMVLLLRARQQVLIESAIFTELAYSGYWDQRPLLNLVHSRAFTLVVMEETMKQAVAVGRFTNEVARAIEKSYPSVEHLDKYVVRRPAGP